MDQNKTTIGEARVKIKVDSTELNAAIEKANRLKDCLQEAAQIVDSLLASIPVLSLDILGGGDV